MSFNVTGSLWTATKMPGTSNNTEEKDGGHGSKGDSSLARATHVDNPIREEEINTGAPALLSWATLSTKRKKIKEERERRTKMMIFSFIRFVAACLL